MRYINRLARRKDSEGFGITTLNSSLEAVFNLGHVDKYMDERTGDVSYLGTNELGNCATF